MFKPTFPVCCWNDERDVAQPTLLWKFFGHRGAAREFEKSAHETRATSS